MQQPDPPAAADGPRSTAAPAPLAVLGWAVYLASSWTWCIGMFLPVLLLRDFGLAGWVAFALPNVIGAAGMAWVLSTRSRTRAFVEQHRRACLLFSLVCMAFQLYFIGWLSAAAPVGAMIGGCLMLVLAYRLLATRFSSDRDSPVGAWLGSALTWCASAFVLALAVMWMAEPTAAVWPAGPGDDAAGWLALLLGLTPVSMLGFVLCPYLDLTFHHALEQLPTPAARRWAFGLGFGVFFLAMIVLTVLYAAPVDEAMHGRDPAGAMPSGAPGWLLSAFMGHIVLQAGFTTALHLRRVAVEAPAAGWSAGGMALLVLFAGVGAVLAGRWLDPTAVWRGISQPELVYRGFMGFYGLVFPAMVLILVGRGREEAGSKSSGQARRWLVLATTIAIALPFYAVGFFGGSMLWLGPGAGVVLAGAVVVRLMGGQRSS